MAQIEARVREDLRREVEARWQSKVADAEARAAREKERRVLAEAQASGAADAKRSLDELGNAMGELNELSAQAAQQVHSCAYLRPPCYHIHPLPTPCFWHHPFESFLVRPESQLLCKVSMFNTSFAP